MVSWYNYVTFDLIGDLAFGKSFGCLEEGGYHIWVSTLYKQVHLAALNQVFMRYPVLKGLAPVILSAKTREGCRRHVQFSRMMALERIESADTDREDFMSYILRNNRGDKAGEFLNIDEMYDNSSLLILAGSETSATIMSGATYYLLTHRDKYDALIAEICDAFRSEDEITMISTGNLKYLNAVVNEALRIYPAVPVGMPRKVPRGGDVIVGHYIPENTAVSVGHWPAYQSKENRHRPQEFIPERWLGDPEFANDKRGVFQPFSFGPRNCIGKNLAYAEMRLIMARLLFNFDFELMSESYSWPHDQKVFFVWDKGPLAVRLTTRAPTRKA